MLPLHKPVAALHHIPKCIRGNCLQNVSRDALHKHLVIAIVHPKNVLNIHAIRDRQSGVPVFGYEVPEAAVQIFLASVLCEWLPIEEKRHMARRHACINQVFLVFESRDQRRGFERRGRSDRDLKSVERVGKLLRKQLLEPVPQKRAPKHKIALLARVIHPELMGDVDDTVRSVVEVDSSEEEGGGEGSGRGSDDRHLADVTELPDVLGAPRLPPEVDAGAREVHAGEVALCWHGRANEGGIVRGGEVSET